MTDEHAPTQRRSVFSRAAQYWPVVHVDVATMHAGF